MDDLLIYLTLLFLYGASPGISKKLLIRLPQCESLVDAYHGLSTKTALKNQYITDLTMSWYSYDTIK